MELLRCCVCASIDRPPMPMISLPGFQSIFYTTYPWLSSITYGPWCWLQNVTSWSSWVLLMTEMPLLTILSYPKEDVKTQLFLLLFSLIDKSQNKKGPEACLLFLIPSFLNVSLSFIIPVIRNLENPHGNILTPYVEKSY